MTFSNAMRMGLAAFMLWAVAGSAADRPDNSLSTTHASAPASDNGNVVIFSGTKYFLRTAKDGQYVFTPNGQEDLQRWTDMISLSYYPEIKEGNSLAAKAIDWWKHCRSTRAHILQMNFVPRIDQMPARDNAFYTTFTLLEKPYNDYDEFAYTALRIVGGIGATSTYSHREYRTGMISPERNFTWARKNDPVGEAWFVWDGVAEYAQLLAARHPGMEVR